MDNNPEISPHIERSKNPEIKMGAASLASTKHLENEDAVYMSSDSMSHLKVFAVFDGMGGHEDGAKASSTALHAVKDRIENGNVDPNLSLQQTEGLVKSVLLEAHEKVKAQSLGEKGMGTTASVGMIWEGKEGERKLVVGNVGDSSIYICRDGKLTKLTVDDDLGHMGRGNILTQALGRENIEPRMSIFDILPGDQIITISDGISDAMKDDLDEEFQKALVAHKGNPAQAANALVVKAKEFSNAGRKEDDKSAIVVEVGDRSIQEKSDTAVNHSKNEEKIEKKGWLYRLPPSTMVKVKRSDGRIEDDWFIVGEEKDKLKLVKSDGVSAKTATPEQLDSLNPPIEKVNSWDTLNFALNQLPDTIKGSHQVYSKEKLFAIIEKVRQNELTIEKITRTYGLREKVEELLQLDKTRNSLNSL